MRTITKAVFFDLDNTLYDVQQYFLGAFKDISLEIAGKHGIPEQRVYKVLVELWREKTSMYSHLFDDLLGILHLNKEGTQNIVRIFNEYAGTLELYPDVIPTLQALKGRNYKLGIITDGNVERQKRKIKSLKLEPFFNAIIYTNELEPKPSSLPFLTALTMVNGRSQDSFYVGDNPVIDFKGAKAAGIETIRIVRGEFAEAPWNEYIDVEIKNLDELLEITGVKI